MNAMNNPKTPEKNPQDPPMKDWPDDAPRFSESNALIALMRTLPEVDPNKDTEWKRQQPRRIIYDLLTMQEMLEVKRQLVAQKKLPAVPPDWQAVLRITVNAGKYVEDILQNKENHFSTEKNGNHYFVLTQLKRARDILHEIAVDAEEEVRLQIDEYNHHIAEAQEQQKQANA